MPSITLPEALRYFFAPFVLAFYYCVYDPVSAQELSKNFGVIPAVAFLVAGTTTYYFYRYVIYADVIMPLYDVLRKENLRIFIKRRYGLSGNPVSSTRAANRLINELSDAPGYSTLMAQRGRPIRAGGVHLLYQAVLWALPFVVLSLLHSAWKFAILFGLLAAVQLYTALRIDTEYENEELLLVTAMVADLDKAAERLGLQRAYGLR